jgi:tetratricopeptide (TPR) repeat protein
MISNLFRYSGRLLLALTMGLSLLSAQDAAEDHDAAQETTGETTTEPTDLPEDAVVAEPEAQPEETAPEPVDPDEVQGLLALGLSLTQRGDYEAGEIAYRQALETAVTDESVMAALFGLARLHRKEGSFIKSIAIYQRLIKDYEDDPQLPDALLELGRTQREAGAHKSALSSFYSVINSTLKIPADKFEHYQSLTKTAQFEIAETHFMSGNFSEAAKFFARVRLLDLAPVDRARAHFKSAYAQQLGGDLAGAVVTLQAFIEQHPHDENVPEARYLRSTLLRSLNRTDEALASTLQLLRAEQTHSQANPKRWAYWQRRTGNQLANEFFTAGDTINALSIYQNLANLSDDIHWRLPIIYQTALCYERLRQFADAKLAYETIIETIGQQEQDPPGNELAELLRMSTWRLQYISWNDRTERQLASIFDTTTGQPSPPHLDEVPDLTHDTTGNPLPSSSDL